MFSGFNNVYTNKWRNIKFRYNSLILIVQRGQPTITLSDQSNLHSPVSMLLLFVVAEVRLEVGLSLIL